MAIPKLFEAITTLSPDEMSDFGKFLLTHTSEGSDNYRIYKLLKKNQSSLTEEGVSEQMRTKYFAQMRPKVFSNMLSRLFKWFEDWFAIHVFQLESFDKDLMLIKGYNERGLFKLADSQTEKLKTKIEDAAVLDFDQSFSLNRLSHLQYFSNNPIKRKVDSRLFTDCLNSFLSTVGEYSGLYFLELVYKEKIRDTDYSDFSLRLEEILSNTPDTKLKQLLNTAIKMMRTEEPQTVIELKNALQSGMIDPKSDLYLALTYYLRTAAKISHASNLNERNIFLEANQMNLEAIHNNSNQKLRPVNLFNCINGISHFIEFESVKPIIEEWAPRTVSKYPESIKKYCHAINNFRHQRFEPLPGILSGLEFDDIHYKFISTAMLIISFYELGEDDLMTNLIQNFRRQLTRNKKKLAVPVRAGLSNLIEVLLLMYKSKYKKATQLEIDNYKPLFFKSWVINNLKRAGRI